jgi:hypothetical protein
MRVCAPEPGRARPERSRGVTRSWSSNYAPFLLHAQKKRGEKKRAPPQTPAVAWVFHSAKLFRCGLWSIILMHPRPHPRPLAHPCARYCSFFSSDHPDQCLRADRMSAWSKQDVCLLPQAGCRKCGSHDYARMA